jgi:SpoVK/Ycf46/Vps4 family AAA+-type ATPase
MAKRVPSKCAVIFFDEIDALGQSRENSGTGEGEGCSRRVLTELLLQLNVIASQQEYCSEDFDSRMDAMADAKSDDDNNIDEWVHSSECNRSGENLVRLVVVAATNRLEDCDAALLRRFGIQLEVRLPSLKDRKKMLSKYLNEVENNLSALELHALAAMTEHWSGSTLENLAREAAMRPIRECLHKAAVIRRRAERLEQRGGDASGQDDVLDSPDDAANVCLLEGIQNLRPVTMDDFCQSIPIMTGEDINCSYPVPVRGANSTRQVEHYDSSSSSDSEH